MGSLIRASTVGVKLVVLSVLTGIVWLVISLVFSVLNLSSVAELVILLVATIVIGGWLAVKMFKWK